MKQGPQHLAHLPSFNCLACGEWLGCNAGEYTGYVTCPKCEAKNYFDNSVKPVALSKPVATPLGTPGRKP
jgi:hypothetical protein